MHETCRGHKGYQCFGTFFVGLGFVRLVSSSFYFPHLLSGPLFSRNFYFLLSCYLLVNFFSKGNFSLFSTCRNPLSAQCMVVGEIAIDREEPEACHSEMCVLFDFSKVANLVALLRSMEACRLPRTSNIPSFKTGISCILS